MNTSNCVEIFDLKPAEFGPNIQTQEKFCFKVFYQFLKTIKLQKKKSNLYKTL